MSDLLLGVDVGTTAVKTLVFTTDGRQVASATYDLDLFTPQQGWAEQDPEQLWEGVVVTLRSVMAHVAASDRLVALSQSSQGGTTIPVDVAGHPVYRAISWMDERAGEQARRIRRTWGDEFIHATTGWPLYDGLPLQHIGWLRDNRPDVFSAASHYLFVNDFVTRRLTGRLCMNRSDASITQLMNVATGDWDERLLDAVGITRSQLSPLCPSGYAVGPVTKYAADATDLPEETLVITGAHDQYCAAVSTGVVQPGPVLLSCGTAWVVLVVSDSLDVAQRSGMAVSRHAVEGKWGALRSLGGVGTSLEWLLDHVWGGRESLQAREPLYDAVSAGVARSRPGANGLLFYPLAGGHATTIGTGRGGFVGLALSHTRDDLGRAVMEGLAYELRWLVEEMLEAGLVVAELRMVGGAAQSPVWPQIVADVTGIPVRLAAIRQAACQGAAILAGVGAGVFSDAAEGLAAFRVREKCLEPSDQHRGTYDAGFGIYRELYESIVRRWKD